MIRNRSTLFEDRFASGKNLLPPTSSPVLAGRSSNDVMLLDSFNLYQAKEPIGFNQ